MFYNARWYDPALGRFAQADSIVPNPYNAQSYDRYAYALNSPIRYTDPTGNLTDDEIKKWTRYDLDYIKTKKSDLYKMLRSLHLGDNVYYHNNGKIEALGIAGIDEQGMLIFGTTKHEDLLAFETSGWIVTRKMSDGKVKTAYFSGPYTRDDFPEGIPEVISENSHETTVWDELGYNFSKSQIVVNGVSG